MKRLLTLEPALVRSIAAVVVLIGSNVGLNIADAADRTVTVVLAILALLPLVQAWWTRQAVTPNAAVVERKDGTTVVAGPANDLIPAGERVRKVGPHAWQGKSDA